MKKLFMFLAVAGLATFGASCSSDDNSDDPVKVESQLALKADKTDIKEGESVKFTVTLDGKGETAAELSIDGVKIDSPHTFKKEGQYNVVAKKKGAKDSAAVKITVAKGDGETPVETKTLVLEADLLEVNVGDKVTFKVTDGKDAVKDVVITEVGGKAVAKGVWTAEKPGTFKFVATKDGFEKSNEFSIEVIENTVPEVTPNSVVVGTKKFDLGTAILGVNMYPEGGKFIHRPYILDGKVYFLFTYQMFAGSADDEDAYENAWEVGGAVVGLQVAIPQDGKTLRTPENTPTAEWMFVDLYAVLDGESDYGELLDGKAQIAWAASEKKVGLKASGIFTLPVDTNFEIDYQGESAGLYRFEVKAPETNNTNSLKQAKANVRASKKIKMVKN